MALCKKLQDLSIVEKTIMVGQIVHCIQSDDEIFEMGEKLIKCGYFAGLFNTTTINPPNDGTADIPNY